MTLFQTRPSWTSWGTTSFVFWCAGTSLPHVFWELTEAFVDGGQLFRYDHLSNFLCCLLDKGLTCPLLRKGQISLSLSLHFDSIYKWSYLTNFQPSSKPALPDLDLVENPTLQRYALDLAAQLDVRHLFVDTAGEVSAARFSTFSHNTSNYKVGVKWVE